MENVKQTILVVDDEVDFLSTLAANLEHLGFECLTATDGKEALTVLMRHMSQSNQNPIQIILSDLNMPNLDGTGLLQAVRASEYSGIAFVLLSGAITRADLQQYIDLDVDGVLVKPATSAEIVSELKLALVRREIKLLQRNKTG